ncbi:putative phage abortive infection protein [uncultured Mediterranea sp.]|uniref:putative phage abortive infection protein n=1 Tax=uncultured Mediterranea sp. TaxID=1926662 RepID=UPI0027D9A56D|nr:putative phage abortive infection protein [uncultured Mediterranea sp.]
MENNNLIKKALIICSILSIIMLFLFAWKQDYGTKWPLATDIIGQYGDFIGGVIGTILSIVLLYSTFQSQIKESRKNADVFTKQQFHEIFSHLIQQHNSIINNFSMQFQLDNETSISLSAKEAIHFYLAQMQRDFDKNKEHGRKAAVEYYMNFYASNKDFAPIYFRILYRIFDLIKTTNIDANEKVKYAKIIRAQLTDSELIMIRYNAMTKLGKNMQNYIVQYNLLKHMPPLSLLEFGEWRALFIESLQNKANIILYTTHKLIHDLITSTTLTTLAYTSSKTKYNINVSKTKDGSQVKLDFNRRLHLTMGTFDEFYCFETISLEQIEGLFEAWIKEIFIFSCFNANRITIENSVDCSKKNNEHFTIIVTSKNNKVLII